MKKFTFSTEESDEKQPAIIDINNTAPMDFVGRLCVSKLKIPRNTLPIALVPPLQREFTAEEKQAIDDVGETPTEYYYALFSSCNTSLARPTNATYYYRQTNETWTESCKTTSGFTLTNDTTYICLLFSYWARTKPIWEPLENGNFILVNKRQPIYSWAGCSNFTRRSAYRTIYENTWITYDINIHNEYNRLFFHSNVFCRGAGTEDRYSTPTLALSPWLKEVNGLKTDFDATVRFRYDYEFTHGTTDSVNNIYAKQQTMYIMPAKVTYNPYFADIQRTLRNGTDYGDQIFNLSATYDFYNFNQTAELFPIEHFAIQCLDLNYDPEDIPINTIDLTGTIVPSHMYFLKTFLISTRVTLSDFLYLADNTTVNTIDVNSPRITRLQFRFMWITKNHEVYDLEIWKNNVVTLELTLYPFDEEPETKRRRE